MFFRVRSGGHLIGLVMGITGVARLLIGVRSLLTDTPDPPSRRRSEVSGCDALEARHLDVEVFLSDEQSCTSSLAIFLVSMIGVWERGTFMVFS